MVIGQRYKLEHGTGIYIGYEEFYDKGTKSRIAERATYSRDSNSRRVFALDPGHTWFCNDYYYEWLNGIRDFHVDV